MDGYKAFAVTVKGGSHEKSGTVCQDDSTWDNTNKNVLLAVVADGHGDPSCFRSDRGSQLAVLSAKNGIQLFVKESIPLFEHAFSKNPNPPSQKELEKLIREKLIKQIVASWNMYVMDDLRIKPFTEQELAKVSEKYRKRYENNENVNKAYGTSLIAAAITPWYWFGFHIGDGRFSVLYQDSSGGQPVPWDKRCYLNVTTSICDDDILDRGEEGVRVFVSLHSEKTPPVGFFLCSDGIDDNFPVDEKENAECLYRLYREIAVACAEDGYLSTFGKDGKSGQLKDLINKYATNGKKDDTSLAGFLNEKEIKKVLPQWKEKMAADEAAIKKAKDEASAKIKAEAEAQQKAAEAREARRAEREKEEKAKTEEKPQSEENTADKSAEEKPKAEAKTIENNDANNHSSDAYNTQESKPQLGTKIDTTA